MRKINLFVYLASLGLTVTGQAFADRADDEAFLTGLTTLKLPESGQENVGPYPFLAEEESSLSPKTSVSEPSTEALKKRNRQVTAEVLEQKRTYKHAIREFQGKLETMPKQDHAAADLKAENESLKRENARLATQLTDATKKKKAAATTPERHGSSWGKILVQKLRDLSIKSFYVATLEKELAQKLAATDADASRLGKEIEALTAQNAQLTARLTEQNEIGDRELSDARNRLVALEKELAQKSVAADADTRRLGQEIEALTAQNAQLTTLLTEQNEKGDRELSDARSRRAALEKELAQKSTAAGAEAGRLGEEIKVLAAQNAQLTARLTEQNEIGNRELSDARSHLASLEKELAQKSAAADADASRLGKEIEALTAQNAQLTARLTEQNEIGNRELSDARNRLAALEKELAQKSVAADADARRLGQEIEALTAQNAQLTARLTEQNKKGDRELSDARSRLASLEKELAQKMSSQQPSQRSAPSILKTNIQKESYALGASLANEVIARVQQSKQLGINIDLQLLSEGFNDARNNELRLKRTDIETNVVKLNKRTAVEAEKNIKKSLSLIKQEIGNRKTLKKQSGITLVVVKKGQRAFNIGDLVEFKITEKIVAGKTTNSYDKNRLIYGNDTPEFLKDAIVAGGKGGVVHAYGLGGHFYQSGKLPTGLTMETPILYIISMN
ncbi:TPA: hypothetical protein LVM22_001059 [Klebsiella oxytoca]|nr:hypothetical protein [Klebsiella oxytoca]